MRSCRRSGLPVSRRRRIRGLTVETGDCSPAGLSGSVEGCKTWHAKNHRENRVIALGQTDSQGAKPVARGVHRLGGMSKQKGPVPKIAKLTGTDGAALVDVESGILVGVGNDVELPRASSRGDALPERRSQPPSRPSSKLSRN